MSTCSIFCPTPSISSMIVNHFNMRTDVQSYHLGGMGCSNGVVAVNLIKDLLKVCVCRVPLGACLDISRQPTAACPVDHSTCEVVERCLLTVSRPMSVCMRLRVPAGPPQRQCGAADHRGHNPCLLQGQGQASPGHQHDLQDRSAGVTTFRGCARPAPFPPSHSQRASAAPHRR